jgi:hypothetical protein
MLCTGASSSGEGSRIPANEASQQPTLQAGWLFSSGGFLSTCSLEGRATIFPLSLAVRDSEAGRAKELGGASQDYGERPPGPPQQESKLSKAAGIAWLSVLHPPCALQALHAVLMCPSSAMAIVGRRLSGADPRRQKLKVIIHHLAVSNAAHP